MNERREAVLPVSVLGSDGKRADIEAIMDTGFTGHLTLPDRAIEELSLASRGAREAVLADGSTVTMEIYRARVAWDGEVRGVQILASAGDALVGMSLLHGCEVRFDAVYGGEVVIRWLS